MINKQELRRFLRVSRNCLAMADYISQSHAIAQHFFASALFSQAERVAVFISHDCEVHTGLIIENLQIYRKKCYLPCLQDEQLIFREYSSCLPFRKNRYGISEPISVAHSLLATQLDVVLVPLVGVDRCGHRLGMGKGYYDKTFAFKNNQSQFLRPVLWGLALDCQLVSAVPCDEWDVPLDGIITADGLISISRFLR